MKTKRILSLILRIALLVCCWKGVGNAIIGEDGFMSSNSLLFYTIQSNLWVMLMTAIYLIIGIRSLITGSDAIWRPWQIARYMVLIGITITFLIFWGVLAPTTMGGEYLLSTSNLLVHTAVPLLYIFDFFLFDRGKPVRKTGVLWVLFMPLYYFIFSLLNAALNPDLSFDMGSGRYPYFFMNIDKYGWFGSEEGIGVFWWVLLIFGLTIGLGFAYRFLHIVVNRKAAKAAA